MHVQYFYISDEYRYCLELWPNDSSLRLVYGLSVFAVRSAAPLLIISYCHWRIARLLTNQSRRLALMRSPGRQLQDVRRKQRLQTLLLVMVLIFAISSFPLDLYNVIQVRLCMFCVSVGILAVKISLNRKSKSRRSWLQFSSKNLAFFQPISVEGREVSKKKDGTTLCMWASGVFLPAALSDFFIITDFRTWKLSTRSIWFRQVKINCYE